jgi:uncharacterized protein YfaS (alpha-2-macroglobulin family)
MNLKKLAFLGLSGVLFLSLVLIPAYSGPPVRPNLGDGRCLTYLSTDKPIYREGEKVYVRGVVLDAASHAPLPAERQAYAMTQITGPKGDVVASGYGPTADSVVRFAWEVPAGQAGGEYTIKVSYPSDGYAPAERKFDIRAYRAPRLKSQIVFLRDGYGPGDAAGATLHVERAEGGIPQGTKVTASARVDGAEAFTGQTTVDAAGNCTVNFKLPEKIERGEGTLSLAIEDGAVVETAAKTIPILLQTVDLGIYPEGGDLVAGLSNRVYIEAKTPAQKPADIAGVVIDGAGTEVAAFRTEHEGRGRFEFTPAKGGKYGLRINEPAGIKRTFDLPAVKDDGIVLRSLQDIAGKGQEVELSVASTTGRKVAVTLSRRETELASVKRELKAGQPAELTLTPPASADGVLIATVWDEKGAPLAERLVFRQPAKTLNVSVKAEQASYVPGDKAMLTVTTTDDDGKPVGAVVGLTITDDSILEMIEKREQSPRLPVMVLLENDVKELADAHVYLDPANPKAPLATDLLLGTQGWRRFALENVDTFLAKHGDAAKRALAAREVLVNTRETDTGQTILEARFGAPTTSPAGSAAAPVVPRTLAPARDEAAPQNGPEQTEPTAVAEPMERPADMDLAKRLPVAAGGGARGPRQKDVALQERQFAFADTTPSNRNDFIAVRVYAHELRPNRRPTDRTDFAETLYWNAGVRTDDKTGQATISFALSDAVTSFRASADAFDSRGAIGSGSGTVESVKPFYVEPKLPLELTQGDVVRLPVGIVNGMRSDLAGVQISAIAGKGITLTKVEPFALKGKARDRRIIDVNVGQATGASDFVLNAIAGPYADNVTRKLNVQPRGFPVEVAFGGMTGPDAKVSHEVLIPGNLVPNSVTSNLVIYPTPLANLTEALQRLIQEPGGCFEQTSSTCYPLVMAQQYFLTHTGVDPRLIEQSRAHLDSGYARLTGFECKQRGYEWFGGDPGHEALTAYGLMEFSDMSQVRTVDPDMLQRTRQWLLARRDGKGGFQRSAEAIDNFGAAPPDTTNAYVVWALLESGEKGLDTEAAAVKQLGISSDDTYIVALAANIAALEGDKPLAITLMDRLLRKQAKDGSVEGAVTSITHSGGESLTLETTALSVLAWLREPAYAGAVEKSMNWLTESCKAGRFGSTQSTILCLRAIIAYDKSRATPKAPGTVQVIVDGHPMGGPAPFAADTKGAIKLADVSEMMSPGKHIIELRMAGGSSMPYAIAVNYNDEKPASSEQCKVKLQVDLKDKQVLEGTVTEADVTVTNSAKEGIPTPVAIVGIPGGLEVRHDQLKELVKSGKIDAYEVKGREVILYWRQLKAAQEVRLPLSLVAAVPGTYTAPASRAYLYYTDEFKDWVAGPQVTITPRLGE